MGEGWRGGGLRSGGGEAGVCDCFYYASKFKMKEIFFFGGVGGGWEEEGEGNSK